MTSERWMSRWWEGSVVALAINSLLMGVLAGSNGYTWWAIGIGFVPAALLLIGLAMRNRRRDVATALLVVASVAAAFWFWMIYPVVLALVVVFGGFAAAKIGPPGPVLDVVA